MCVYMSLMCVAHVCVCCNCVCVYVCVARVYMCECMCLCECVYVYVCELLVSAAVCLVALNYCHVSPARWLLYSGVFVVSPRDSHNIFPLLATQHAHSFTQHQLRGTGWDRKKISSKHIFIPPLEKVENI